jgi:hypothetical protein
MGDASIKLVVFPSSCMHGWVSALCTCGDARVGVIRAHEQRELCRMRPRVYGTGAAPALTTGTLSCVLM